MLREKDRIREFWSWFAAHQSELSRLLTPQERFWDVVLEQIKKVDAHLAFELSRDCHPAREFVITAGGHVDSFSIAEELVGLAPDVEGWTFVALKPAQGFKFKTTYEGIDFDPRRMWFLPLDSASRPMALGIRVGVPDLHCINKATAHDAVLVILETGIGERSAALDIQHTEVTDLPSDPPSLGYIELCELADYIKWRKTRVTARLV